jgi:hypothetical protein
MATEVDIAVIGGGAAGLAAAIFAAEAVKGCADEDGPRLVVLDGAKTIGAKILVSGGGRCNVTHAAVRAQDFYGSQPMIRNVLAAFTEADTGRWFASLGVELKQEETGKLFPVTDQARTVLDALLGRCRELGVVLFVQHRVIDIQPAHGESVSADPRFHRTQSRDLARSTDHSGDGRTIVAEDRKRWARMEDRSPAGTHRDGGVPGIGTARFRALHVSRGALRPLAGRGVEDPHCRKGDGS